MKTEFVRKTLFFAVLLLFSVSALTQTNSPGFYYTTNLVEAHSSYRRVNGQLYNTEASVKWSDDQYSFVTRTNGVIIAKRLRVEPVYKIVTRQSDALVGSGNFIGSAPGQIDRGPTKVKVGENKIPDRTVAITNLTTEYISGEEFGVRTILTARISYEGAIIELRDFGTPNIVAVITTNLAPKKTVSQ